MDITKQLLSLQDQKYRDFHARLMPTVEKSRIIGVRTPVLRKFSKEIANSREAEEFLNELPHFYYEENNLHAMLIEYIKDENEQVRQLDEFLPYVDNWATCDLMRPKALLKNKELLLKKIQEWLKSDMTYTARFAMDMLLVRFLDEDFDERYLKWVADYKSEEYYIKMMKAWYFATALCKQYDSAVKYLVENKLDVWTHNKTIQKARESFRVDTDKKEYLKSLKRHC